MEQIQQYERKEVPLMQQVTQNFLMAAIALGAVVSGTHGGLGGGSHGSHFSKPTEFHAKVLSDSHTHGHGHNSNLPIDPRALKNMRPKNGRFRAKNA